MSKFREYFTFTRSERNGILVLLFIIIVLIVSLQVSELFFKRQKVDYSAFEKEIDNFISSIQKQDADTLHSYIFCDTIKAEYFLFDPNTVSETDLQKLGFSQKLIKIWMNFRNKGGKFYDKDDVKKIYGLTDSVFKKIEPYITIPEKPYKENLYKDKTYNNSQKSIYQDNKYPKKTTTAIDINCADTTALCTLPGIGPGYAKKIIKYRDKLGGFVKKEQLLEVFGFTQDMYLKIETLVFINVSEVNKINLNNADFKQLIRHPYFKKNLINKILEYRKIQGKILNLQEIVKNKMITPEEAEKIEQYSEF